MQAGFFDGGASASLDELLKALNKALSAADPQQASAILSHILDKKGLTEPDRNKFGIMKCRILFGYAASHADWALTKIARPSLRAS